MAVTLFRILDASDAALVCAGAIMAVRPDWVSKKAAGRE